MKTGEFKLDEYNLVIRPDLTLSAFKAGDIPFKQGYSNSEGANWFHFEGRFERLQAQFNILFYKEVLYRFGIQFDKKYNLGQRERIEGWLTQITGEPMPFEYEWGCLLTDIDQRSDNDFEALTKHCILDFGKLDYPKFLDLKSFYAARHSDEKLRTQIYGK